MVMVDVVANEDVANRYDIGLDGCGTDRAEMGVSLVTCFWNRLCRMTRCYSP